MIFDPSTLHDLKLLKSPVLVFLPNGRRVQVTHHGKLKIGDRLELNHVLLVPRFKYNLLSMKKFVAQLQCQVVFTESLHALQGPSLRRLVGIGKEACSLYILDKDLVKGINFGKDFSFRCHDVFQCNCNNLSTTCDKNFNSSYNDASQKLNVDIWHKRMGHIPYRRMKFLPLDVDFTVSYKDIPCEVCPKAKQQRLPFHLSSISTSTPFELIHVNSRGPYHTKTHAGHRFFLTIVDDFTRAT